MEFDLENPLAGIVKCADESAEQHRSDSDSAAAAALFAAESDHATSVGKLHPDNIPLRRGAASLLLQKQCTCNTDPSVVYLAINYMDRFLTRQTIPGSKPWMERLLAITCLSLACKMNNSRFSLADFQGELGAVCEGGSIRRMELLVLTALDWRMRSVTPFSFLPFFLGLFCPDGLPSTAVNLKARASQIVFIAQNGTKLLDYKPSVVAASALLAAAHELLHAQLPSFRAAVSSCPHLHKKEVWDCYTAMGQPAAMGCCGPPLELTTASRSTTPAVSVRGRRRHRHGWPSSESEDAIWEDSLGGGMIIKRRHVGKPSPGMASSSLCISSSDK